MDYRLSMLQDEQWLRKNETKLRELVPANWTHKDNLVGVQIGFNLKLIGVDWRSDKEFAQVMTYLTKIGMFQIDGVLVRRNPHSIFKNAQK